MLHVVVDASEALPLSCLRKCLFCASACRGNEKCLPFGGRLSFACSAHQPLYLDVFIPQLVARKRELTDKLAHDERKLRALKEGVAAAKERMDSVV
jgi:hypothetical protein